jgi:hypothetical protein
LAYNASPAAVQAALTALSSIGAGNVQVGPSYQVLPTNTYTITFVGTMAGKYSPLVIVDSSSLTGGGSYQTATPYSIQQGHMHRIFDTGGGNYSSVMVDNNVIFRLYSDVNLQPWGFPPLVQGNASSDVYAPTPLWQVVSYHRFAYGVYIAEYQVKDVTGLRAGMTISISGCTDTTFNLSNVVINGINKDTNVVQVIDGVTLVAVGWKNEPSPGAAVKGDKSVWLDNPLQSFPYHVRSSVYGNKLYVKMWRINEMEPPNGIVTTIQAVQDISSETLVPSITGHPGYCGLIVNHLYGGSYMEYGDVEFTKL